MEQWISSATAHGLRAKAPKPISPARSAWTRCFRWATRHASVVVTSRSSPAPASAWHTHPLGQTLIVTSGLGWAQCEGGPIEEIRPGDVVWFPPGEKHWHGATAMTAMTHIAITESLNGKNVDWMEKVSDEQYGR